jgi:hypothetical protein
VEWAREAKRLSQSKEESLMFVENYRLDTMIGGQVQTVIPYPRISEADWLTWKAFLPVKSVLFNKNILLRGTKVSLRTAYSIPFNVYHEMVRGAGYFEEIEVWGKREIHKDPIAVGIARSGDRYLIARWGMDKLIPFERIKSRSWLYRIQNFGVNLFTSEKFWLTGIAALILGILYIGTW